MSTFWISAAEYWLTQIVNLFGLYHYDADSATAECADLLDRVTVARWPQNFGAMLRAASFMCAVLAVFGRARDGDQQLNRLDEAFAYLAIALSVDLWEQL
jgi:hypothetical protein